MIFIGYLYIIPILIISQYLFLFFLESFFLYDKIFTQGDDNMFAQRLKKLRTEKQISQAELATVLNISNRTISMYEQGNSEPTIETLSKMADYFNVTTDYLIGRSDGRTLENQEIHKSLGLTDESISTLSIFKQLENNEYTKNQLRNINVLLSDLNTLVSISDYLNTASIKDEQYVVCNYYVSKNGEDLISPPDSKEKMLSAEQWRNIFFAAIQENLIRLKNSIKDE